MYKLFDLFKIIQKYLNWLYFPKNRILINNNIKIENKTIKKNKKIDLWNITGIINKIYSGCGYKVKILSDSNKYFNKNEGFVKM